MGTRPRLVALAAGLGLTLFAAVAQISGGAGPLAGAQLAGQRPCYSAIAWPLSWGPTPVCAVSGTLASGKHVGAVSTGTPLPCAVVHQTNDQCPVWVSTPYQQPDGLLSSDWVGPDSFQDGAPLGRLAATSPDGSRVFTVGTVQAGGPYACTLAGQQVSVTGYDIAGLAYSVDDGSLAWQKIQGPLGSETEVLGNAIAASTSRVYITGLAAAPCGAAHEVTIALDAVTGQVAWVEAIPATDWPASDGLAVTSSPDGRIVYVVGTAYLGPNSPSSTAYVRALDEATGSELWRAVDTGYTAGKTLSISPDGSTVTAGYDDETVDPTTSVRETIGSTVTTYDAHSGHALWSQSTPVPGQGGVTDVAYAPNGSRIFTLTCDSSGGGFNSFDSRAYSATNGTELWEAQYGGSSQAISACPDNGGSLVVSPDGTRLYETGNTAATSQSASDTASNDIDAVVTLAYDSTNGKQQWTAVFNQNPERASVIALSPDGGTVYVAAQFGSDCLSASGCIPPPQFTTLGYAATSGTELWQAQYGNPISAARAIVTTPGSGRVVVIGDEDQCGVGNSARNLGQGILAIAYNPSVLPATLPGMGTPAPADAVNCAVVATGPAANAPEGPPLIFLLLGATVIGTVGGLTRRRRRRLLRHASLLE